MKVLLKLTLSVALFFLLTGCELLQVKGNSEVTSQEQELIEIKSAEKALDKENFEEAKKIYRDFQGRHAKSLFFQSARLGEAKALHGLGQYKEAADLNREINLVTIKYEPGIAALASYNLSLAYESLGEDEKAVAALLDAQKLGSFLPAEISSAEIPARFAAAYGRKGLDKEVFKSLTEAENGIAHIRSEKGVQIDKNWLGKTYFQMGSVSTNQLSVENFNQFINGQKWVQNYLLKAIHLNDPIWSFRAQMKIQAIYRDLFTLLSSIQSNRQLQRDLGADLFDLIQLAELYKPIADQEINTYEEGFFAYLNEVKRKTEDILYKVNPSTILTIESETLNSIKRSGRVKVDSLLPIEENSFIAIPSKEGPSQDPNL